LEVFPPLWVVGADLEVFPLFGWLGGGADLVVFPSLVGWRQDNGNRSNQESKFDFLATRQRLVKIDEGQQKIKIVRTNRQSNLRASCQSIFSLCLHHTLGKGCKQTNEKNSVFLRFSLPRVAARSREREREREQREREQRESREDKARSI